jgi:hypothetical protein
MFCPCDVLISHIGHSLKFQDLDGERKTDKQTDGKMGVEPDPVPRLLDEIVECLIQQDQQEQSQTLG